MRIAIFPLVLVSAVGTIRTDEQKIDVKDLPKAVLAAVKAKFPEGKVTGAAKEEEGGKVTYEVALEDKNSKIDVAVSAKGKILEVEKTIDEQKLPKAVAATLAARYPKARPKKSSSMTKTRAKTPRRRQRPASTRIKRRRSRSSWPWKARVTSR